MAPEELKCMERHEETCSGNVEKRASMTGTGTPMVRCHKHHERAVERHQAIRERYPDSSTPPDWFDPSVAGERWDSDY